MAMHRASTACGKPKAKHTSGLVAYSEDEPVGWVAVEPRSSYPKLRTLRVPWAGRSEDKDDAEIWAVTCFCVRKGYRGRGITYPLARAADHAREKGATAVEGYAMVTQPGWRSPGARSTSGPCGLRRGRIHRGQRPTKRRRVMRVDF
jgi:GNAT superfamily N-acetyltransferase